MATTPTTTTPTTAAPAVQSLQHAPLVTPVGKIATGGCPAVVAYLNRGSDENRATKSTDYPGRDKYYNGTGEEFSVVTNYLAQRYQGKFKAVANADAKDRPAGARSYEAAALEYTRLLDGAFTNAYAENMREGARAAIADLNAIHAACPTSRLVVVGYSQGALVARTALATTADGKHTFFGDHLDFTPGQKGAAPAVSLMFGDPGWGKDPVEYGGVYYGDVFKPGVFSASDERGAGRVAASTGAFPAWQNALLVPATTPAAWNLASLCHGEDAACQVGHQAAMALLGNPGHMTYDERDFFAAAGWVSTFFATHGTPLRATSGAAPGVDLSASSKPCLSRTAPIARTLSAAASASGSTTFTVAWSGHGTVSSSKVTVAAGAKATVTARSTASFLDNDTLTVSAPATDLPGAPVLPLYVDRICPAL